MTSLGLLVRYAATSILLATVVGCGSSSGHPDTGYGAGRPVPPQLNCVDICQRIGDCAVQLCNEDTMSTRYSGLDDALALECESTCTDALIQANLTASEWQCLFQSTCRAVFERDVCQTESSYFCE